MSRLIDFIKTLPKRALAASGINIYSAPILKTDWNMIAAVTDSASNLKIDWNMIAGVAGFITIVVAVLGYLLYFFFEDKKRGDLMRDYQGKLERSMEGFSASNSEFKSRLTEWENLVRDFIKKTEKIVVEIEDLKSATQTVRPNFTTFITNQWRIFDRMSRYRHEKLKICQQLVNRHISTGDTILLDSGSTVDQVTSELIGHSIGNITIYSNNVLAAMHLTGTSLVNFYLFQGEFFQRSWAVYSEEANQRMDQLAVTNVIIAAAAFRAAAGVYVRDGEDGNHHFKRKAVELFLKKPSLRLTIAIDGSKFYENIKGHHPIFNAKEWNSILSNHAKRIVVVTSDPPRDATASNSTSFNEQISKLRDDGVTVDIVS